MKWKNSKSNKHDWQKTKHGREKFARQTTDISKSFEVVWCRWCTTSLTKRKIKYHKHWEETDEIIP